MALGGATREFMLRIVADVKDATRGMDQVESSSKSMRDTVTGIGKSVATGLAVGAVVNFGKESVTAAAEAEQAMNGVRAVFGDSADEIEAFSTKAITSMGISDDAYQAFATTTGGLLKDMGVPLDQTVTMTDELAQRGADLAQVYGVDADQAFTALQKGIGGSYRGLKELGISLDKNEVEARAMANGWVDAGGNVTEAGKAMAAQQLIMEKTADKAGEFSEHSGEVANQQKILALQFEETKETIGNALLPMVSKLMAALVPLLNFTAKYADILVPIAGVIGGIVLAMKAYQVGQLAWEAATKIATAAQWLWNAAMTANPIGLIVAAIAAVIAIVVLLYMKVDWFRAGVDAAIDGIIAAWNWLLDIIKSVFNWVKDNWPLLLAIITGPIGIAVKLIVDNWDTIKNAVMGVFNWIKTNWPTLLAILTGPFGLAVLAISRNWDTITAFFRDLPGKIAGFLSSLASKITSPFTGAKDTVLAAVGKITDWFREFPGKVNSLFSNLANIIKYPFTAAFNAIKSLWNSTVGGFGFTVPSWVPGVGGKGFRIPSMATGGIVSRPTIALIGEAGPEAVVPLGSGHGFGTTIINVYALTANAEVGRKVYEALREYERTSGKTA